MAGLTYSKILDDIRDRVRERLVLGASDCHVLFTHIDALEQELDDSRATYAVFVAREAALAELLRQADEALGELADEQALFAPQLPPIYMRRLNKAYAVLQAIREHLGKER